MRLRLLTCAIVFVIISGLVVALKPQYIFPVSDKALPVPIDELLWMSLR